MAEAAERHHADRVMAVVAQAGDHSPIAASWRRCLLSHRLDPEKSEPPVLVSGMDLHHARDHAGRVLRTADPELDRLHRLVGGLGYHVLMTEQTGVVVTRRVPSGDETGCRKWCLWTGAVWSEEVEGTNGVGTCLVERRPVTVHREQHFRRRHTPLTCTVAPLFNPVGELAGALDASSFRPDPSGRIVPLVMAAVREAARRIEKACFHRFYARSLILALPEQPDDPSVPLLALDADRRIVGATHAARQALGLTSQERIGPISLSDVLFAMNPTQPESFVDAERTVIEGTLARTQGNVTAAAAMLGISRATLHRKIRRLSSERRGSACFSRASMRNLHPRYGAGTAEQPELAE